MLESRDFTFFTDHKPLTHALFRVSPPWFACQQRHLSYLAEFTSSLVHVPGSKNVVADALSRPSLFLSLFTSSLVSPSTPSQLSPTLPTPSQLSQTPSPPSSDKPVISGFDVSLQSWLQLTCPSVSEMFAFPTLSVVSVWSRGVAL